MQGKEPYPFSKCIILQHQNYSSQLTQVINANQIDRQCQITRAINLLDWENFNCQHSVLEVHMGERSGALLCDMSNK